MNSWFRWFAVTLTGAAALTLAGCGDDEEVGGDDLEATCEMMSTMEGPDDITVERLDELLQVAPDQLEVDVRMIRDRLAEVGEAAYEDEEVGSAFERVGTFEEEACP